MNGSTYIIKKHNQAVSLDGDGAGRYHIILGVLDCLCDRAGTLNELATVAQELIYNHGDPITTVAFAPQYATVFEKVFTPCAAQPTQADTVTVIFDFDKGLLQIVPAGQATDAVTESTVRMYPARRCYLDSINKTVCESGCEMELDKLLNEELSKLATQRADCRERTTLFELYTACGTTYFMSRYGGGMAATLSVLHRLQKGISALSDTNIVLDASRLMEGMLLDHSLLDVPSASLGMPMFEMLDDELGANHRLNLNNWGEVSQVVSMNFYGETVRIEFAERIPHHAGDVFKMTFQQAEACWNENYQTGLAQLEETFFAWAEENCASYPTMSLRF